MLNRLSRTFRYRSLNGWQSIYFSPEQYWVPQLVFGDRPKPYVLLAQHKWKPTLLHASLVPSQDCGGGVFWPYREALFLRRQQRARSEPDQIHGVGINTGLVEIVDAPDKPAVAIAPSAKIFDVQVAHCEDRWRWLKVCANISPQL